MVLLLLALAHGFCARQEVDLLVQVPTHPRGSMYVRVAGGDAQTDAADAVQRVRLRGPGGALVPFDVVRLGRLYRFDPREPLVAGTYQLERRADFGADGRRIRLDGAETVHASGWFAVDRVEVSEDEWTAPAVPDVSWSRWHTPPGVSEASRRLDATGPAVAYAVRVDLEVFGVGVIDSRPVQPTRFLIWTGMTACTPTKIPVPTTGDLRVRVVAEGPSGLRTGSDWTDLGPSVPSNGFGGLPGPARPSNRRAEVAELSTWERVEVPIDVTPVSTVAGGCGSLEPVGERVHLGEVEGHRGMLHDSPDGLHWTWVEPGRVHLDGQAIEVPGASERTTLSAVVLGSRAYLLLYGPASRLLVVEGGRVVSTHPVPHVRSGRLLAADDGFELAYTDAAGSRFVQRYDRNVREIGDAVETLHPVQVGALPQGIAVNGHPIAGSSGWRLRRHVVHEGAVYGEAYGKSGAWIFRADERGNLAWDQVLADQSVRSFAVDGDGIHAHAGPVTEGARGAVWRTWTHDGREIAGVPTGEPPRTREIYVERFAMGEQTLLMSFDSVPRLSVVEGERSSSAIQIPPRPTLHVEADHVDVGWIEDRRDVFRQRYACGGEALGIPDLWTP